MVGNFLLVGEELKRHIPWAWGTSRDKPKGIISIGYVALPAGMSIDDFGVVEFLRFDNREGDQFLTRDADGVMKPECMTGTVMRTEFKGNVVVPPRRPGGSATIVSMCDIPAFRLEAAKASPCDRVARSDKALTDKLWKAVEGLPWQRTNMEKRPALGDPDAYSADGQSLVKPPVVNPPVVQPAGGLEPRRKCLSKSTSAGQQATQSCLFLTTTTRRRSWNGVAVSTRTQRTPVLRV